MAKLRNVRNTRAHIRLQVHPPIPCSRVGLLGMSTARSLRQTEAKDVNNNNRRHPLIHSVAQKGVLCKQLSEANHAVAHFCSMKKHNEIRITLHLLMHHVVLS